MNADELKWLILNLREWPSLPFPDSPRGIKDLMVQAADAIESVERRVRELVRYIQHLAGCPAGRWSDQECTCGLDAARVALSPQAEPQEAK